MEGGNETRVIKFRRSRQQLPLPPDLLLMILVWTVARHDSFLFSSTHQISFSFSESWVRCILFHGEGHQLFYAMEFGGCENQMQIWFVLLGCNLSWPFHASHPAFLSGRQPPWLSDFRLNHRYRCSKLLLSSSPSLHYNCVCMLECVLSHFSHVRDPMDCSPPGSSFHGILQAGILEWVAVPSSGDLPDQESNQPCFSLLHGRQVLYC